MERSKGLWSRERVEMVKNRHAALREGIRAMRNVSVALLLLAALKFAVGIIANAPVLVADSLHTLVDLSAVLAVLLGIKLATRPPSERFPYGYYKAESLAALFVSVIIMYGAYELVGGALHRWKEGAAINMVPLASVVAAISLVLSYILSKYEERAALLTGSDAISATSKEALLDVFSSGMVLVSILLSSAGLAFVESAVTILISLLVFKLAFENVYSSIMALMDVSPSRKMEQNVRKVLESMPAIVGYRDMRLRKAGPFIFGEVTIITDPKLDVEKAHSIADEVERKVMEEVPQIEHLVVHLEPYEKEKLRVIVPVTGNEGMNSKLAEHFGRAEGFLIFEVEKKKGKMKLLDFVKNLQKQKKVRAGLAAAKQLLKNVEFDAVITKEMGEIAFHVLKDEGKDVYRAKGSTAEEAVKLFMKDELEKLDTPTKEKE